MTNFQIFYYLIMFFSTTNIITQKCQKEKFFEKIKSLSQPCPHSYFEVVSMGAKKIQINIGFTEDQYDTLQGLSQEREVPIAAIVREAIKIYLEVENERL